MTTELLQSIGLGLAEVAETISWTRVTAENTHPVTGVARAAMQVSKLRPVKLGGLTISNFRLQTERPRDFPSFIMQQTLILTNMMKISDLCGLLKKDKETAERINELYSIALGFHIIRSFLIGIPNLYESYNGAEKSWTWRFKKLYAGIMPITLAITSLIFYQAVQLS